MNVVVVFLVVRGVQNVCNRGFIPFSREGHAISFLFMIANKSAVPFPTVSHYHTIPPLLRVQTISIALIGMR